MDVVFGWLFISTFLSKVTQIETSLEVTVGHFHVLRRHPQLRQCVVKTLQKQVYVGSRITDQTGVCEGLPHTWARNQTIESGYGYGKNVYVRINYQPPLEIINNETVLTIPGVVNTDVKLNIHMTWTTFTINHAMFITLKDTNDTLLAFSCYQVCKASEYDRHGKIVASEDFDVPQQIRNSERWNISFVAKRNTLYALAERYGVGKSTVSDLLKKKEFYTTQWESNANAKKIRFNTGKYDKLNELVWEWFCMARSKNIPVSGPLIQEKASEYAKDLQLSEFKASNGWLHSWKNSYNVKGYKVCGESGGVITENVNDYKKRIPEIISGYDLKDIFNCDETGLYYRALPDKTLSVKGQGQSGTKVSKDRVTVMFACSASGEKLKPLVLGKFLNPRCLKNVDRSALGLQYKANKKGWMTNELFVTWLKELNSDMRKQGRNIILLLDNASSHGSESDRTLSNVTLKFLPPNTTSHLQPLDQGIIRTFKAIYRKYLLRSLLSVIESAENVQELCKQVTLLDCIQWIVKAWKDVKETTIEKCFRVAGFSEPDTVETEESVDDDCDDYEDDDVPLSTLVARFSLSVDDIHHIDDGAETEESGSEDWEKNLVENYKSSHTTDDSMIDCDNDDVSSPDTPMPGAEMTYSDVLTMAIKLKNFAQENDSSFLELVEDLKLRTEKKIVSMKCFQKQTKLDSFFVKK